MALSVAMASAVSSGPAQAQLIDQTQVTNDIGAGIALSLEEQIGAGRGDLTTPGSSIYLIKRDPARSIRRGRQLFQRKFRRAQGLGPRTASDGIGDIVETTALGAGLADSCAACHGRPRGAAGFGGDVATRPDSRDSPHLFGLGLQEQLADEITSELRAKKSDAIEKARSTRREVTVRLRSKGIDYGTIIAKPNGQVDSSRLEGIDLDLRVRPFFAQGGSFSMREFIVGAFKDEMGLEAHDPCLATAATGGRCVTPAGLILDGKLDSIATPPAAGPAQDGDGDRVVNEIDPALVDHMEFYLLNYFKPGTAKQTKVTDRGFAVMEKIGCTNCHIRNLTIRRDRRVADVETEYDRKRGIFNRLFASVEARFKAVEDGQDLPKLLPKGESFVVRNIFTDFKRHNLGKTFYERNYDGSYQTSFMTEPLWGVGSTSPYGHDGRSINLYSVILRHGGEARASRRAFERLRSGDRQAVLDALASLVLFPPDDTASTLDPGDRSAPKFPQNGHGSIKLGELFTTPGPE